MFKAIKFLFSLNKEMRNKFLLLNITLILSSILDVAGLASLLPLFKLVLSPDTVKNNKYLGFIYEAIGFQDYKYFVVFFCVLVVVLIIVKNLVVIFLNYIQTKISFAIYKYLTLHAYEFYFSKGYAYFKEVNSNVIFREIRFIPQIFISGVLNPVMVFVNECLVISLIMIGILFYNAEVVFLLVAVVVPVFTIFYKLTRKKIQEIGLKLNEENPRLGKVLFQTIHGYVDTIITNSLPFFKTQYRQIVDEFTNLQTKTAVLAQVSPKLIEFSMVLSVVVLVVYGTFFMDDTQNFTTLIAVFGLTAYRALPSINKILTAMLNVKQNSYTVDSIRQINFAAGAESAVEGAGNLPFNKQITVKDLDFSYKRTSAKTLDNLSFTIRKGECVGIVGRSGSGKTTFINILLRFLEETGGNILVDDVKLSKDNIISWRNKIGYVQQEVFLLDATLAENIAFGQLREDIDLRKLESVLKKASLVDFVNSLPDKHNTVVGERGAQLSGGQKQRIGIARALYHGAEILVFDEATSALDTETEQEITESIRSLTTDTQSEDNLTMVIIAHRVTTLKYCDKIIKIEHGKVENSYSYSDIIKDIH
jgi:ABC-type multidrug transport system fused ATPase/permease subunit